jgi:hypothetical protein
VREYRPDAVTLDIDLPGIESTPMRTTPTP